MIEGGGGGLQIYMSGGKFNDSSGAALSLAELGDQGHEQ